MNRKKSYRKEILKTIGILAVALIVGFYLAIVLVFSAIPTGIQAILFAAYLIGIFLLVWLVFKKRLQQKTWRNGLCVACAGFVVCGALAIPIVYEASLPTLDERMLMVEEYQPYMASSKVAKLEEPSTLALEGNLPKIDCATALYPVAAAFVQTAYPNGEYNPYYEKESKLICSGTTLAYEHILEGDADILLVAGPSQEQLNQAHQAGVELKLTPIGQEAFVFFVNTANPIDTLTIEQIQSIYSGETTNWAQLGAGSDSIRAFQRDEGSGSQTALQKLMAGKPLMQPPRDDRVDGMGGMIKQVADYKNFRDAIGFSFRFYSTEMVQNSDIKLLALNGIYPNKQTIEDGSYPLSAEFYAVTVAGRETENTRKLINWMRSAQGQQLVEQTGYVPLAKAG